ncbi:MAG: NAD(P)/FAD-dependent oxidoreductase [Burkholderiaceae bacterium]|nr:NAD(P)/FAD-dependent oxidoreductase [Burkholderiaceae bacterium]
MIRTDALVIGAGPVGLFAVFELGLLELGAQVVDALPHAGGQCTELYADKPIYDIPGLPASTGADLVQRLQQQITPFRPGWHLGQQVASLAPQADGRFQVSTDQGTQFDAGVVLIAAGAGAFVPRSLKLEGLEQQLGRQVHHRMPAPAGLAGRQVVVSGDEDLALGQAADLAEALQRGDANAPARVSLLHRRDQFRASPATLARVQALREAGALHFVAGQPQQLVQDPQGRLQALRLIGSDEQLSDLPCEQWLLLLGLSPRLGPLADWGLALQRKQLVVDTAQFQTSQPGVYAAGDIVHYPGKRKLLLCGFHEATLAAFAAAERLRGGHVHLQYTTTSPRLHQLLGLEPPADAG